MYIPPSFAATDLEQLHAHIEQHSFATLVSIDDHEPIATHLPLLLDRTHPANGRLTGHVAKANPQWKTAAGRRVLAIFHGPHAYITPTWYSEQNVVPTWNYSVVHAYGTLRPVDDAAQTARIVRQYVQRYEAEMDSPWSLDSVAADFVDQLVDAVVSFTIDIDRLEGKWKLSQNHSTARQANVIAGLNERNGPGDQDVAALMTQHCSDAD